MARSFWRGAISFGLVSIPVKMYVGTEPNPLVFHFLHKKCLTRPHEILHCDKDSEDITIKDTVRGYEYAKGQYVVLDEKDFARIPIKTIRTIDITDFVPSGAIDPIYYNDTHYLEPETIGVKPFLLLREALVNTEKVAIAKVSFQRREHLCCLRPSEDSVLLHTLHYSEQILPRTELAPARQEIKPEELKMAISLINIMSNDFVPEKYHDEYRIALQKLIEAKIRGKEIVLEAAPTTTDIPDLMAALRASIESTRKQAKIT
jgi:DNA end-binding protein Ku